MKPRREWLLSFVFSLACDPSGSTAAPDTGVRLNAPLDADAEYPPTCSELGPSSCAGPCGRDDAASCLHLAEGYLEGVGVPRDPKRALGLMRKSCELGLGRACGYLAMAIGTNDRVASTAYAREGCEKGYGGACVFYVADHVIAVPDPNWEDAVPWLKRGCATRHPRACLLLGDVLRTGIGAPRDTAAATEAYRTACDARESEACDMLELPPDKPRAHVLATPDPAIGELARAGVTGTFRPKVSFCVGPEGVAQVTAVEGATGKLAEIVKATVSRWRFTPSGVAKPACSHVVFALHLQ